MIAATDVCVDDNIHSTSADNLDVPGFGSTTHVDDDDSKKRKRELALEAQAEPSTSARSSASLATSSWG